MKDKKHSYSKHLANFEEFCWNISLTIDLLISREWYDKTRLLFRLSIVLECSAIAAVVVSDKMPF